MGGKERAGDLLRLNLGRCKISGELFPEGICVAGASPVGPNWLSLGPGPVSTQLFAKWEELVIL